jgi:hypothetical protein
MGFTSRSLFYIKQMYDLGSMKNKKIQPIFFSISVFVHGLPSDKQTYFPWGVLNYLRQTWRNNLISAFSRLQSPRCEYTTCPQNQGYRKEPSFPHYIHKSYRDSILIPLNRQSQLLSNPSLLTDHFPLPPPRIANNNKVWHTSISKRGKRSEKRP